MAKNKERGKGRERERERERETERERGWLSAFKGTGELRRREV